MCTCRNSMLTLLERSESLLETSYFRSPPLLLGVICPTLPSIKLHTTLNHFPLGFSGKFYTPHKMQRHQKHSKRDTGQVIDPICNFLNIGKPHCLVHLRQATHHRQTEELA
eukprot:m.66512 g.66512  ORF g.66512 m.66512 type:complete len:111 (+) comp19728_c0_seq2:451-783(+)